MINLPFEDLEKAIGKLEDQMSTINSFMSASSQGKSTIKTLYRQLSKLFGKDTAKTLIDTSGKTYEIQNRELEK